MVVIYLLNCFVDEIVLVGKAEQAKEAMKNAASTAGDSAKRSTEKVQEVSSG